MLSLELLVLTISLFTHVSGTPTHDYHTHFSRHPFHPRNYVTPDQRLSSYDFVVAGGGLAGLVVAARLSDNSSNTVLVLEAGPSGDAVAAQINTPAETYFDSLLNADPYDWLYKTVPQANAGNRVMVQPRGRVLGGSSAVNGMYMVRPSSQEVNAWSSLIAPNDQTAANVWGWDNFFAALKKSENFTGPVAASSSVAGMQYTQSSHGTGGDLQTTYPAYMVPVSGAWLSTLAAAGIPTNNDGYSGNNLGGFFATSAINPTNWTRSYSKPAYIDSLPPRANLHVISGVTVEQIVFADNLVSGNVVASSVNFSTGAGTAVQSVQVNKEVLLAGGAMGSAHILLVSGVGPKDVLQGANVALKAELPGVGQHLIDHLSAGVFWQTTVDTQGSIHASGSALSQTPEFNSFINSGIAYVNGSLLFSGSDSFSTFRNGINSSAVSSTTLAPSQYSQVIDGYKAIYDATLQNLYPTAGLVEILLSLNSAGQIAVQAALQQPLSQGRLYINSSSIYDKPLIDPQYFSHPADITVLRQGIKLARQIGATAPLSASLGTEVTPGPNVQSDQDIENWLRNSAGTEYHPQGACSMLPQNQGGVVDAKLKVYGTSNVRVVDSSVFPVSFSAHLMAPTYALAETASSIILAAYSPTNTTGSSSNSGTTSGSSASPSASTTKASNAIGQGQISISWIGLLIPFIASLLL
ncbi:hypothetical protein BDZ97DRAFT_1666899 [Flammula alnicola]|nr:hypothetical protein BDZ97DRAFT_1666899 [Flammula alnicola]